jgi:hypothetical protein
MSIPRDTARSGTAGIDGDNVENRLSRLLTQPGVGPSAAGWLAFAIYAIIVLVDCPPPFLGHDTEHFQHWTSAAFEYGSSAIDQSVMSPFQGLGGLVQPLCVGMHPVYAISHAFGAADQRVGNLVVAMVLLGVSTFVFARAMGLSGWLAVFAAQAMAIGSLPPFWSWTLAYTKTNGLLLYGLSPALVFPVAAGVGMLAAYAWLGRLSRIGNIACLLLLPMPMVYSLVCDPLYTGMFFLAIGVFMAGILLGSESRHMALWRIGGGAACLATLLALNLHNFMRALFGYCARARFPNELYVEVQQWDYNAGVLFHGGFATFVAIGTACAAVAAVAWGPKLVRGVAASVLVFMAAIVAMCWVYVYGGVRWNAPLPNYLELPAYPVYTVIGLLGAIAAITHLSQRSKIAARCRHLLTHPIARYAIVLVLPAMGVCSVTAAPRHENNAFELVGGLTPPLPAKSPAGHGEASAEGRDEDERLRAEDRASNRTIVGFLREEIAIRDDGRFRGSVANLFGIPGGPLMARLGYPEESPCDKQQLMFLDGYLRSYDRHLPMSGLWDMRIPTLEDNNHVVTPPFHYLLSRLLSRPQDYHSRNWATLSALRPGLMAALGTRFVLTDRRVKDAGLVLRHAQRNADGITIYAYELAHPNLGDYSPTEAMVAADAPAMVAAMKDDSFDYRTRVVVERDLPAGLVPASSGQLLYERGGARIRAASPGRSLLVLPLQFSHSLNIIENNSVPPEPLELRRVNMVEIGLLFSGTVDVKLAHAFGPFRGSTGRLQDIEDCKRLGIREDGMIPYPPGYQPLSRDGWKITRGLMPPADDWFSVDAFLTKGGEHWKTDLGNGGSRPDEPLWIWPVQDSAIPRPEDSPAAPFEVHWRLKPNATLPAGQVVWAVESNGQLSALRPAGFTDRKDGIANLSIPVPPDGTTGNLPICLVAVEPQPRRLSNVVILAVNFTKQVPKRTSSEDVPEAPPSSSDAREAD